MGVTLDVFESPRKRSALVHGSVVIKCRSPEWQFSAYWGKNIIENMTNEISLLSKQFHSLAV